jgi:hypothetical protein
MKIKLIAKLISVLLFLFVIACGQQKTNQETGNNENLKIEGWETLNQQNYSIQYPANWKINSRGLSGTEFILLSDLKSDKDKFRENINLIIQDVTGENIDLDKYVTISEEQIRTKMKNSEIIMSTRIKNNQDEYHKIIYSGDQKTYRLTFEQYYRIYNDKVFVLTLACEKDEFADFSKVGEKILDSFKIKK